MFTIDREGRGKLRTAAPTLLMVWVADATKLGSISHRWSPRVLPRRPLRGELKRFYLLGDAARGLVLTALDVRLGVGHLAAPAADLQEVREGDGHRSGQERQKCAHLHRVLHSAWLGEGHAAHEQRHGEPDARHVAQNDDIPLGHAHGELEPQGDAQQGHERDADRLADEQPSRHEVRAGVHGRQHHAGAHEAEQAEHHLYGVLEPARHVVEGVGLLVFIPREQPAVIVLVRHDPHQRHQGQGRVDATLPEAVPGEHPGQQVPGPGGDAQIAVHEPADGHGEHHRGGEHHVVGLTHGVEHRQDAQPPAVVRHREQQQERNGRVALAKNEPRDQVAERDVGGGGHGPAVVEAGVQGVGTHEVDDGRARHAADGGEQGQSRGAQVGQRAAGERALPDLLRREREEEGHQDFVHQEVQAVGDLLVGVMVEVGEDEG